MAIKLQCLLVASAGPREIEQVKRWLDDQGVHVTGAGARSVSAEIEADVYRRVFGEPPASTAAFAASAAAAESLPVPAALRDVIELITLTPRHDLH